MNRYCPAGHRPPPSLSPSTANAASNKSQTRREHNGRHTLCFWRRGVAQCMAMLLALIATTASIYLIPRNSSPFRHHTPCPDAPRPPISRSGLATSRRLVSVCPTWEQAPTETMQLAGRPNSSSPPSPSPYTPSTCSTAYDRLLLPRTLPRLLQALSITRAHMHALPAASASARRS